MVHEKHKEGVIGIPYQFREHELYVLLLHRIKYEENGWIGWEFPKGRRDGKRIEQAMYDELKEEANIYILFQLLFALLLG